MEENDVYYVIQNMNFQYEICDTRPKNRIFRGTYEECEAFIVGTKNSDWPNAEFCFIVEVKDTTKDSFDEWSVHTDKAVLYRGSKSECEAFKKGVDYEIKGRTRMEEKSNNLRLENDESLISPSSVKSPDEELKNNLRNVILSDIDTSGKIDLILAICRPTMVQIPEIISLKETT